MHIVLTWSSAEGGRLVCKLPLRGASQRPHLRAIQIDEVFPELAMVHLFMSSSLNHGPEIVRHSHKIKGPSKGSLISRTTFVSTSKL